jgi:L-seryl-tRNA(Ser) seleniumtransferase
VTATDPRRALPSVHRVLDRLDPSAPFHLRVEAARAAVDAARGEIERCGPPGEDAVVAAAADLLAAARRRLLGPVLNATGVLLHTNLGRAPLGETAASAALRAAGYANVEYHLDDGTRGSRHDHAGALLARYVGADSGIVVNNNAGAVLLALAALARGREVVVSRGELVEIGGGFRVPEIMAEAGARLVEVGTTNRTRRADYEHAVGEPTALVLKVHASNYRMVGFTEATPVAALATLGPPVMVDAGSGLLDATAPWLDRPPAWLRDEPGVRQCLDDGAALVTFSGDKLLGGPQAGVVVGRADLVERCARHPLARALRADKLTLAALQAVALAYLDGDAREIPLWHMVSMGLPRLRERAGTVAARVPGAKVVDTDAVAGGGSLPGLTIPSLGVAVEVGDVDATLRRLRHRRVVALARDGAVVCDLRSIYPPARDDELAQALREVLSADAG